MTDAQAGAARRAWWAVLAWVLFELLLTSLPGDALPEGPGFRVDWLAHGVLYFGLGFLVARAGLLSGWRRAALVGLWGVIAGYAAGDELHQRYFIPGREAEWMDWIMDVIGSAAGLASGTLLMRERWAAWLR